MVKHTLTRAPKCVVVDLKSPCRRCEQILIAKPTMTRAPKLIAVDLEIALRRRVGTGGGGEGGDGTTQGNRG